MSKYVWQSMRNVTIYGFWAKSFVVILTVKKQDKLVVLASYIYN